MPAARPRHLQYGSASPPPPPDHFRVMFTRNGVLPWTTSDLTPVHTYLGVSDVCALLYSVLGLCLGLSSSLDRFVTSCCAFVVLCAEMCSVLGLCLGLSSTFLLLFTDSSSSIASATYLLTSCFASSFGFSTDLVLLVTVSLGSVFVFGVSLGLSFGSVLFVSVSLVSVFIGADREKVKWDRGLLIGVDDFIGFSSSC